MGRHGETSKLLHQGHALRSKIERMIGQQLGLPLDLPGTIENEEIAQDAACEAAA